jgi:hypothetical protein
MKNGGENGTGALHSSVVGRLNYEIGVHSLFIEKLRAFLIHTWNFSNFLKTTNFHNLVARTKKTKALQGRRFHLEAISVACGLGFIPCASSSRSGDVGRLPFDPPIGQGIFVVV